MGVSRSLAIALSQQRWLPYKTRRSVIKRLHPAMLRDYAFETPFCTEYCDLRFRGNIVNYIDRLVYFCGAHEKYMLQLLYDYVIRLKQQQEHITFVDVGANAGNHTLFMATQVSKVYAFEPFKRVRLQLEDNLALNHIGNVTIFPFGLSNEDKVMPFYAAPDSNLGAASFQPAHKQDNFYLGDLQLKRGDDVLHAVGAGKVDIIKADIEGYEKFALEGLRDTLRKDRPLVIVELSPTTRETLGSEAAFYELFPSDYRYYYFASANYNSGSYQIKPFDYSYTPKIQDVIACPAEHAGCLMA